MCTVSSARKVDPHGSYYPSTAQSVCAGYPSPGPLHLVLHGLAEEIVAVLLLAVEVIGLVGERDNLVLEALARAVCRCLLRGVESEVVQQLGHICRARPAHASCPRQRLVRGRRERRYMCQWGTARTGGRRRGAAYEQSKVIAYVPSLVLSNARCQAFVLWLEDVMELFACR